ncbi:DNA internalization-related competence protein ComEC/Rec2 [Vibrio sp. 10N.286.49.B3]|nr:DNA internalization-related competence protein ComEC/Rec2 [Vibrio sp. 10N.286.49.B3]
MALLFNSWTLVSFVITLLTAPYWPGIIDWPWIVVSGVVTLLGFKYRSLSKFIGISCALSIAIYAMNLKSHQIGELFQSGQNITINGEVESFFKPITHGYKGVIFVRSINGEKIPGYLQPKVELYVPFMLHLGDIVNFSVMVKPILGRLNEAGFDQESYFFSQSILAKATVDISKPSKITSQANFRGNWFQDITQQLEPFSYHGIIKALSFGYRNDISLEQWDQLKSSGLIHLMAISGLHIGIAFSFGYSLGAVLRLIFHSMLWLPLYSALFFASSYAWLAGFTLPTQRALIMCVIASVCLRIQWRLSHWKVLLLALSTVLILQPFSNISNSFWLSFGAVAIIFVYLSYQTNQSLHGWKGYIVTLLKIQGYLLLCMTPLTVYLFGGFSLIGVLYNIIFVPWVSMVVVPLIFIGLIASFGPTVISDAIWFTVNLSLEPIMATISYADVGWIQVSQTQALWLILLMLGVLALRVFQSKIIALWVIAVIYWLESWLVVDDWKVDVLDVGHGLAVLIEQKGEHYLYDTGNKWPGGSVAQSIITPILQQRGEQQLSGLILSHLDSDHAGGREEIEVNWQPLQLFSSQDIAGYQACIKGSQWQWLALNFEVLWPPKVVSRAYNPHSCVVRIQHRESGYSVLITGDIDALSEWLLLQEADVLKSDIVIVPHHGSKTSSTARFVEAISPSVAIASLAHDNRWGLPAKVVKQRYQDNGAIWVDTGELGQISLIFSTDKWQLIPYRQGVNHSWYRQMLRKGVE